MKGKKKVQGKENKKERERNQEGQSSRKGGLT
jgi:hypothetical protein